MKTEKLKQSGASKSPKYRLIKNVFHSESDPLLKRVDAICKAAGQTRSEVVIQAVSIALPRLERRGV